MFAIDCLSTDSCATGKENNITIVTIERDSAVSDY